MCFGGTKVERSEVLPKQPALAPEVPVDPVAPKTSTVNKQTDTTPARTTSSGTGLAIPSA